MSITYYGLDAKKIPRKTIEWSLFHVTYVHDMILCLLARELAIYISINHAIHKYHRNMGKSQSQQQRASFTRRECDCSMFGGLIHAVTSTQDLRRHRAMKREDALHLAAQNLQRQQRQYPSQNTSRPSASAERIASPVVSDGSEGNPDVASPTVSSIASRAVSPAISEGSNAQRLASPAISHHSDTCLLESPAVSEFHSSAGASQDHEDPDRYSMMPMSRSGMSEIHLYYILTVSQSF